ncbi:hypothetical protein [Actinospica robiniae]|uniref:hypothetical protein n=1 Tax=Actinospica robiniae TaxID=304901 RepID=UPI000417BB31|nr:hypothetical protein [Actinospica robiniae]
MSSLYEHIAHPHISARKAAGPVKVAEQHDIGSPVARFNTHLAIWITKVVGSMWCAYVFGIMDLFSLPSAIRGGEGTLIAWIAQTFLQLVLLSIIMVGQNVQAEAADKRAEATYHDVTALLHENAQLQAHLVAQDKLLTMMAQKLGLEPVPVIDLPEGVDVEAADAPPAAPAE